MAYSNVTGVTKAQADTAGFVPQLWSDEVQAAYKQNLVLANLVKRVPVVGKKGDAITFPAPGRGAASAKVADTAVTTLAGDGTGITISINQHWAYARMLEDITTVQGNEALRSFYTDDAGYALADAIDLFLLQVGRVGQAGNGTIAYDKAVIGSDGATLYTGTNEAAITDIAVRRVLQTLDDNNVPMNGRSLVIPPVAANTVRGLARFTEQAFTGEVAGSNVIRNGAIADLYGTKVFVSSNCEVATGDARIALLFHKDSIVLVEQVKPRVQSQYQAENLGTLVVADTIFGAGALRPAGVVAIAVVA